MAEEFRWEETTKGYVLSSYFWGYIFPQVLGGIISIEYGAKYPFGLGVLLASLVCIGVPFAAKVAPIMIALNAVAGVINACVCPSCSHLISKWAPPTERTKLTSIAYAGCSMGMSLGQPIVGYICDTELGWRGVYYIIALVTVVWYIWYHFYVFSTPEEDYNMSSEERDYIIKSINEYNNAIVNNHHDTSPLKNNKNNKNNSINLLGKIAKSIKQTDGKHYVSIPSETPRPDGDNSEDISETSSLSLSPLPTTDSDIISSPRSPSSPISPREIKFDNTRHVRVSRISVGGDNVLPPEILATHKHNTKLSIPWKKIITNGGVLAIFQLHFSYDWVFYTLLTYLPTFIKSIYSLSLYKTSLLSLFPYLTLAIFQIVLSYVGDYAIKSGKFRLVTVRKSFVIIGNISSSILLVLAVYAKSLTSMVIFMSFATGFAGLCASAENANMMDLSPHYAGVVMGISNTVATLPGIISPVVTAMIIGSKPTLESWRQVFILTIVIMLSAASIYTIFGRAVSQPGM